MSEAEHTCRYGPVGCGMVVAVLVFIGWWASNPSNESAALDRVLIDEPFFGSLLLLVPLTLACVAVAFVLLGFGGSYRPKSVNKFFGWIFGLLAAISLTLVVIQALGYSDPTKGWSEVEVAVLDEMYTI